MVSHFRPDFRPDFRPGIKSCPHSVYGHPGVRTHISRGPHSSHHRRDGNHDDGRDCDHDLIFLTNTNRIMKHNLMSMVIRPINMRRLDLTAPSITQLNHKIIVQRMVHQRLEIRPTLRITLMLRTRHINVMLKITGCGRTATINQLSSMRTRLIKRNRSLGLQLNLRVLTTRINITQVCNVRTIVRTTSRQTLQLRRVVLRRTAYLNQRIMLLSAMVVMRPHLHTPAGIRHKIRIHNKPVRSLTRLKPMISLLR